MHGGYTSKFDGKDVPWAGNPMADTACAKRVDDNTYENSLEDGGEGHRQRDGRRLEGRQDPDGRPRPARTRAARQVNSVGRCTTGSSGARACRLAGPHPPEEGPGRAPRASGRPRRLAGSSRSRRPRARAAARSAGRSTRPAARRPPARPTGARPARGRSWRRSRSGSAGNTSAGRTFARYSRAVPRSARSCAFIAVQAIWSGPRSSVSESRAKSCGSWRSTGSPESSSRRTRAEHLFARRCARRRCARGGRRGRRPPRLVRRTRGRRAPREPLGRRGVGRP